MPEKCHRHSLISTGVSALLILRLPDPLVQMPLFSGFFRPGSYIYLSLPVYVSITAVIASPSIAYGLKCRCDCTHRTRPADPPAPQWRGQNRPASLQHSYTCLPGAGSLAEEGKRTQKKLPLRFRNGGLGTKHIHCPSREKELQANSFACLQKFVQILTFFSARARPHTHTRTHR